MEFPSGYWRDHLTRYFALPEFRSLQETVIEAVGSKQSALVVMPTGAGKSLCYQLPTLALNTRTLVISPLLSLIQDQVTKLKARGFKAEGIYSGLDRDNLRNSCVSYRDRQLNFLFVSPERLSHDSFFEFLLKHRPDFIAVDEAHCISLWGHDFRPDYRTLGEKLKQFAGIPVLAMTATATPTVQRDILDQLGIPQEHLYVSGFWRSNLAIEVIEKTQSQREGAVLDFFERSCEGSSIVYTSSRKKTHEVAQFLGKHLGLKVGVYHAGLDMIERSRVQHEFISGELDIIAATVAFGMGVDKADVRNVVHLSLPNSLESYYQEIGRAGRDGRLSLARMFQSRGDIRTQKFIVEKSYPHMSDLKKVADKIDELAGSATFDRLKNEFFFDDDSLSQILSQLRIHRVVSVDGPYFFRKESKNWELHYIRQRKNRFDQLEHGISFVESHQCRMSFLASYFGDEHSESQKCGLCDNCKDNRTVGQKIASRVTKIRRKRKKH